ncbi:MAG: SDR family NAD(P)-dependent oxidoreductase, partial [Litorivicinaceae bacterium]|nr:SDR family NAD(P)-dependent oxidoreductase [Litorivicinaceae bacterium]
MDLHLDGKRVLITGASRGIGAAMAKAFLFEGARVCIVSRGSAELYQNEEMLISEFGADRVFAQECDCTIAASVATLHDNIAVKW